MKLSNTKGEVFYGLHFYPGVAQYSEPGKQSLMVFLNENTLRKMDKSFAGKPLFVQHVDDVNANLDELRGEADGWVIKSFYNEADGKHWVEFIVTSEKGLQGVKDGLRLSNAYVMKNSGAAGVWNGVDYDKEITEGEYEHLALVPNPRYDESVVMNATQFQAYNDARRAEVKRVVNSKTEGENKMKLNLFKRAKVENELSFEGISVVLPTSKKEMLINELVEKMDKIENMHGYASPDHMVKVDNDEMSVGDLVKKHLDMKKKMEDSMSEKKEDGEMENDEEESSTVSEGEKDVGDRGGDKSLENKEDDDKEAKEDEEKKKNAIEKAKRLKNAGSHNARADEAPAIVTSTDRVAIGKSLFGKN